MKTNFSLCFLLLFAVPLLFCSSCSDGDDKYDIPDDVSADTDSGSEKPDSDNADSNTDTDDETDTANDNDATDTDNPSDDDADTGDETDTASDDDAADTGDKPDNDNDNTDTDSDDDGDSSSDEDTDDPGDSGYIDNNDDDPQIICTGQTQCFNNSKSIDCPASSDKNFFGQDAQYASKGYCLNKSFSVPGNNDQIVIDNITGLIWQRNTPSTYEGCSVNSGALCLHSDAINYCEHLNIGNYDWRLPTPEEIATIIEFGKKIPAINEDFFSIPLVSDKDFWTITIDASSSNKIWYADFKEGSIKLGDDEGKYVRCVAGTNKLEEPHFRILNEGEDEEIVEDSAHNLLWTKIPQPDLEWAQALRYCQKLTHNGGGWRLPNINELLSIINYSKSNPASDFPSLPSAFLWTSTSYENTPGYAWAIRSKTGTLEPAGDKQAFTGRAICVK